MVPQGHILVQYASSKAHISRYCAWTFQISACTYVHGIFPPNLTHEPTFSGDSLCVMLQLSSLKKKSVKKSSKKIYTGNLTILIYSFEIKEERVGK